MVRPTAPDGGRRFGHSATGAVVVLMREADPNERVEMIADCQPAMIVVADDALGGRLAEAGTTVTQRPSRICLSRACAVKPRGREPEQAVTIIYTSGTSVPKGVVLSCGNVDHMLPVTRDALVAMGNPRRSRSRLSLPPVLFRRVAWFSGPACSEATRFTSLPTSTTWAELRRRRQLC